MDSKFTNKMSEAPRVLVTGVSGFIASWVAHGALKLGYKVRGTVRSLANENKVKHLRDLCPGSAHQIELVEANLTSEEGWAAAVDGCTYILHVASPFPLGEPSDENELIKPAVEGTLNVLRAASNMERPPKRIVVTSSFAAIGYGTNPVGKVYTDSDWTVVDSKEYPIGAYVKSKTLAEKAAWEFLESLPAEKKFELSTVNPTLVQGPMLSGSNCSSADLVRDIATGKMPGLPDLHIGTVSVLDVAKAHLLAMTLPAAAGKRFLVTNDNISFSGMSSAVCETLKGHRKYAPTRMAVPNWLIYTLAFFGDKGAKTASSSLGTIQHAEPKNAREILGLPLQDRPEDLVQQMLLAAIHAGIIPDKSEGQQLTKNYVRPEMDVSGIPPPTC